MCIDRMSDYLYKFITNIVIGQKIVDFLSGKKIDIESGIEYFLNHLNIFNQMIGEKWEKKLKSKDRIVLCLNWNGGITDVSKWLAKKKLDKLIHQYEKQSHLYL